MILAQARQQEIDTIGSLAAIASAAALFLKVGFRMFNGGDQPEMKLAAEQLDKKEEEFKIELNKHLDQFTDQADLTLNKE